MVYYAAIRKDKAMDRSTLDTLFQRAKDSLAKALEKHPTFPTKAFQDWQGSMFREYLEAMRKNNDITEQTDRQIIVDVLLEEVLEFAIALGSKDKAASIEEAGDIIAVVLRSLETVM